MLSPSLNSNHQNIRSSQKFLAKSSSSSSQMFFNCCKDVGINAQLFNQIKESTYRPKVSIKQLKRRRQQSYLQEQSQSRSKSKKTKTSIKASIKNIKRNNRKQNHAKDKQTTSLTQFQEIGKSQSNLYSTQLKTQENLAVNNFNTTNYVVGQCLVRPQETNFIFQDNPQINATIQDQLNSIFDSKNQGSLKAAIKIQKKKKKKVQKKLAQNDLKQLRPYANFSFGQRQKQEIFSKYLNKITTNMKQSSNQMSEKSKAEQKMLFQMYQIDSTIQQQMNKLNDEEKNRFLRDTFQKKSLNYLVNKVGKTIFRSESQHTESKESMVIDTHKSIIQKYQNQKEIHLVS